MDSISPSLSDIATSLRSLYDRTVEHARNIETRKGQTQKLYKNYISSKEALSEDVRSFKEQRRQNRSLILKWASKDVSSFDVSKGVSIKKPQSVAECMEYASSGITQMQKQGEPSSDLTGNYLEIIFSSFIEVTVPGFILIIAGYPVSGPIYLVCVLALSLFLDLSLLLALTLPLLVVAIVCFFISLFQSVPKITKTIERERKRIKAGYGAYLKFRMAEDQLDHWYKNETNRYEELIQIEISNAKQIDLDEKNGNERLQAEFSSLLNKTEMHPAALRWTDPIWRVSLSSILQRDEKQTRRTVDAIRIGEIKYPYPIEASSPFLLNLAECRHVFIKVTTGTLRQGQELLKSIVARFVLTSPLLSARFVFIDTKTIGTFSPYRNLPEQIGNYDYSSADEILEQMKSLEFHKKRVQGKAGSKNLESYNQTAATPEMYQLICISGFPNAKRFTPEALGYLENIIESGPQAGIHVIALVNEQEGDFSQLSSSLKKALKSGVTLTPLGTNCEYSFRNKSYVFLPDASPHIHVLENLLPQLRAMAAETATKRSKQPGAGPTPMKVFLCHSSKDKMLVREVYRKLHAESWLRPWLDEENLLPGEDWELEIEEAVKTSDAVIVFLSNNSVTKQGYVHKELRMALDAAQEKPERMVFIIPLRLEECDVPSRLSGLQWVDYFPHEHRDEKYKRLQRALRTRYNETLPSN